MLHDCESKALPVSLGHDHFILLISSLKDRLFNHFHHIFSKFLHVAFSHLFKLRLPFSAALFFHTKHCGDICCGSTDRKPGSYDDSKELKFSNMKAEMKIGLVSQTGKGTCQQAHQ